jgi:hypothetical protein
MLIGAYSSAIGKSVLNDKQMEGATCFGSVLCDQCYSSFQKQCSFQNPFITSVVCCASGKHGKSNRSFAAMQAFSVNIYIRVVNRSLVNRLHGHNRLQKL